MPLVTEEIASRIAEANALIRRDPLRSLELVSDIDLNHIGPSEAIDVLSVISRASIHVGDYANGEPAALRAIELASANGLRTKEGLARNEAGVFQFVRGAFDDALNLYAAAEQLLRGHDEAGRARVFVNIGNVYNLRSEHLQAILAYERALSIAFSVQDTLTQAKVYSNLSGLYRYALGGAEIGAEYAQRAAELYQLLGDNVGLAKSLVNMAAQHLEVGQYVEAEAAFRRSLAIREAFSEPDDHIMTFDGLISALLRQDKREEAEQVYETARTLLSGRPNSERGLMFLKMAEVRLLAGSEQYEDAVALAWQVHDFMSEYGQADFAADLRLMIAECLDAMGRPEASGPIYRELLLRTRADARRQSQQRLEIMHAQMARFRDDHVSGQELLIPLKEQLSQTEATNEEFIGVLAHELKSPLHTMRSVMSLLANADAMSKDERQEYGREMQHMATRMIDQISATLATARQRHAPAVSQTDARVVWEHVLAASRQGAQDKQITLQWSFDRDAYVLRTDEHMLVTIMENLVSNAIKFSPAGSTIEVSVRVLQAVDEAEHVRLEVYDHGPGLNREDLGRLFRPFQTLSARPTGSEGSTGLGLYLVRRTVEILNGRVWGENRPDGAAFFVELPLDVAPSGSV